MNDDAAARRTGLPPNRSAPAHPLQHPSRRDGNDTIKIKRGDTRRVGFIEDLIRQIDTAIYCQISVLYYMDCSLWRLILRLLPQWFLSNKQRLSPSASQTHRTYLIGIVLTYLVCTFQHAVLDPPSGDELSRGYIHGSFLTDFVGEPAPVPKGKLLLVDCCVLALQLLLLAAVLERRDLKLSRTNSVLTSDAQATLRSVSMQDVDAEEQGIRRSQEGNADDDSVVDSEASDITTGDGHILDKSYSGQMMIMTFHLGGVLSKAWLS